MEFRDVPPNHSEKEHAGNERSADSQEARGRIFAEMQRDARKRFLAEHGPIARALKGVKHKVAILSGKGGVGKSVATVSLAVTLHRLGHSAVIFDADVHGPSIPKLLGAQGRAGVRSLDERLSGEAMHQGQGRSSEYSGYPVSGYNHGYGHSHGAHAGHSCGHDRDGHSASDEDQLVEKVPNVDHHSFLFEPVATKHGVGVISVASIWPTEETPVMWKGPHKMRAVRQFLSAAHWGEVDFLLIDLPPGTGDEVQTIMTAIPGLDGMIVITTPQGISRMVCSKAINCAKELEAPLLGLVENMGVMECPHCGGHIQPFGEGKGERLARLMEIPFLGSVPFDAEVGAAADAGIPPVSANPDGPVATAFQGVAFELLGTLGGRPRPAQAADEAYQVRS